MKSISAFLTLTAILLSGCSKTIPTDKAAADYLGEGPVHVLSEPSKIEGWNFQRPDGTIANDPPIRALDLSIARELSTILLSEETYRTPSRGGGFVHDVGFRVWRGDESVDVLLSFGNEQVMYRYRGYGGQMATSSATIAAAQDRLIRLAQRAFPEYKPAK